MSWNWSLPERDAGVSRGARWVVACALLLAFRVGGAPASAQTGGVSSAELAQFEGQYRSVSDPDQVNAVYLDGGILYEESERRARQRLTADGTPDRFRM